MRSLSGSGLDFINVLVADSNKTQSQLLVGALRRQGNFKVTRCEATTSDCLATLESAHAEVVLLDDDRSEGPQHLYEVVRSIHSVHPEIAIVLLLDAYERELVVNSLRAGARGLFCLASSPFKSLCRCITTVKQGQFWTNTEQMQFLVEALAIGPSTHVINSRGQVVLTPREEQTVNLVSEGLNNREIARELSVKESTIKKSLQRIYDKIGVSNRVELVLYAISHSEKRSVGTASSN